MGSVKRQPVYSDYALHPGTVLDEEIRARGISQVELAGRMRRPKNVVNEIIRGKKTITAQTALELERVLGISAETWLNLRTTYELTLARHASEGAAG